MSATPRSPSPPCRRSGSARRRCAPPASPMSASSAGSSTCRWSSPPACTIRSAGPATVSGSRTRATTPSTPRGGGRPPADPPREAGLGFAVRLDTGLPFLGREALLRQKEQPLTKRLVTFVLEDPEAPPLGGERTV